jgi:hypothetical protein
MKSLLVHMTQAIVVYTPRHTCCVKSLVSTTKLMCPVFIFHNNARVRTHNLHNIANLLWREITKHAH